MFVTKGIKEHICKLEVIDSGCNLSSHYPVKMLVKMDLVNDVYVESPCCNDKSAFTHWDVECKQRYYDASGKILINCRKLSLCCGQCFGGCNKGQHVDFINDWYDSLVNNLCKCVDQCCMVGNTGMLDNKVTFMWSEELGQLKKQFIDVHNL
jgi:hypothetical protein